MNAQKLALRSNMTDENVANSIHLTECSDVVDSIIKCLSELESDPKYKDEIKDAYKLDQVPLKITCNLTPDHNGSINQENEHIEGDNEESKMTVTRDQHSVNNVNEVDVGTEDQDHNEDA